MLAKEHKPEMHPCTFPCKEGPICFDAMLRN
nr:hypothetical protein Iba_chr10dCG7310 [Ipomoea batatas]